MLYLSQFEFPDEGREFDFILKQKRTCYDTYYPFKVLSAHRLSVLNFEPITILYGGNGSGKTTVLNVMAEKLGLERSNGESAWVYFTDKVRENGLYLLDEPENSLSPKKQQELAGFLTDSVRFFGCQLVIATHSPFFLALKDAKIYDMDAERATVRHWTEFENVRTYYDFFKKHEAELER